MSRMFIEQGRVIEVIRQRPGVQTVRVQLLDGSMQGEVETALHYTDLGCEVLVGDVVRLNTTAVRLGLGTGGKHFVMDQIGLEREQESIYPNKLGHIIKGRYTPWQRAVLACEEPDHHGHELLREAVSLEGIPVICAELHSQVPAIVATLHWLHQQSENASQPLRVAYVMTEGGAMPATFSETIHRLRAHQLLVGTITVGQTYGGDLESVNLYSGLLAAHHLLNADVIITAMGPGVVGTGTIFGHTGIEQGQAVNAVASLQGEPIVCVRMSFADGRARHRGISHHTMTVLENVALASSVVALPELPDEQQRIIEKQLNALQIKQKHRVQYHDGSMVEEAASWYDIPLSTMGRSYAEDAVFFQAAGAAAQAAYIQISDSAGSASADTLQA